MAVNGRDQVQVTVSPAVFSVINDIGYGLCYTGDEGILRLHQEVRPRIVCFLHEKAKHKNPNRAHLSLKGGTARGKRTYDS